MSAPEFSTHESSDQESPQVAPIRFRGALTVADAFAAVSLAQPIGNKIAMWVIRIFLAAVLIYSIWFTVFAYQQENRILARVALAGVVFVLFLIWGVIGREIWYRRRAKQLAKEGKFQYAPSEGEIDDHSIRTKAAIGESTIHWTAFCGYRESARLALLYMQYPASYVIVARSKFGCEQDWTRFLELASRKLKRL